jgi:hypothetical protein
MKGYFYAKAQETHFMRTENRMAVLFPDQKGVLSATDSEADTAVRCQVSAPSVMRKSRRRNPAGLFLSANPFSPVANITMLSAVKAHPVKPSSTATAKAD